ncbi:response regulator [Paraburkholderia sp. MMS20-SJTR3]|uniref:histidine kinase n=1 Tax=Paraburkholderia sejongensis TaxID=2886946 RepID=A0ABS8K4F4_9BURK|nr:ATP-binding protein [Paraburkholderia sp. MMS20-SJTR3]MCC8397036.1 response regulator [Paraburkholderia sp. MMS20-SJTR3]
MSIDADELAKRLPRTPDFARENLALVRLARAQMGSRADLLNAIASEALELCNAGSAGISLVEETAGGRCFRWLSVAGQCAGLQGRTTAWNECPCGITLDAGLPRLFVAPQQQFACLRALEIDIPEGIVVPIPSDSGHLGAVWVMAHRAEQRFDQEDLRLLSNLAAVAGAAVTMVNVRDAGAESDRRHDEFIAMLAHELRNPMASIDGALAVARRMPSSDARIDKVLTIAERQCGYLRTLLDELLDAARLKHGKLVLKPRDGWLNEIVDDALALVSHDLAARGHTLIRTGLDAPLAVHADPVRLSQILGNLLSNAAKYTPAGGVIELAVAPLAGDDAGIVAIDVKDNGIGIDPLIQPKIFDLFAQSAGDARRSEGGLGIGLAVAKRLVELHGGSIGVHSEGAGKGSRFSLRLPILRAGQAEAPAEAAAAPAPPRPARLLLVDDNTDALNVLTVLLELDGHAVTISDSGRGALALIARTRPEIAIIDVGMPDMDGFEVARAIRANPDLDAVTLVALTGYGAPADKARALAAGFDHHLTKPLSLELLRGILAQAADAR